MKIRIFVICFFVLAGCSEKEEYRQAVLEQMKIEKDIKDYKIEPEEITDCIVSTTSGNMPGLFPFDPERMKAYKNYTKMLTLKNSSDPKKTLEELRNDFGSPKGLADAHANYAESEVNCMSGLVTGTEPRQKESEQNIR